MSKSLRVSVGTALAVLGLVVLPCSGYEGFSTLKIGVGARELALGGTGVADAPGANASYFNPALIARSREFQGHLSYTRWFLECQRSAGFVVRPLDRFNLGFGVVGFDAGRLEYRADIPTEDPQGYFGAQDLACFATVAARLDPKTTGGISLKVYYQKVYLESATGAGLDFGLTYALTPRFRWGLSLTNFSTLLALRYENYSLPTTARLGCSFALPGPLPVTLTEDLSYFVNSKDLKSSTGAEIAIQRMLFLRAGYRILSRFENRYRLLDPTQGLSAGLGLRVKRLRLDYAFVPYRLNLGATHHLSVNFGN